MLLDVDVEAEAAWLLRDFDARRRVSAFALVHHHLGPKAIERLHLVGNPAEVSRVGDGYRIALRHGLPPMHERWLLCHELGEWRLKMLGYDRSAEVEQTADAIAAALVLPRDAFRAALREHGRSFSRLAQYFMTTQTSAALRVGEVTGDFVAVVAPTHIHVRGDAELVVPPEHQLRGLANAKRLPRGAPVKRYPLTDDRRRRVLIAG